MDYLSLRWKEIRPDGARYLVCVMSVLKILELPVLDPLAWNTLSTSFQKKFIGTVS